MDRCDCISDATVVVFLEGGLDAETRRVLVGHIARCTDCRTLFLGALNVSESRQKVLRTVLVTALVLGALAVITGLIVYRNDTHANESPSFRVLEGRLSGDLSYKPHREVFRVRGLDALSILSVDAAATRHREGRSRAHTDGVAFLLAGDSSRAVTLLENATRATPDDPFILTDLSASYHARATARNYAPDHAAALDAAERAWRLRRTPETAWNRAVAISAFSLVGAGERAWDDVLAVERDPAWRREAQQRRDALQTPTELDGWRRLEARLSSRTVDDAVAEFPARARDYFAHKWLPLWANAHLRGETIAAESHDVARDIARKLAARGERLPLDTLAAIDDACRTTSRCNAIARAHSEYARGVTLLDAQQITAAATAFDAATTALEQLRSPFALHARFRRGACLIHLNEFSRAADHGAILLAAVGEQPYPELRARTLWLLGLARLHEGRPEESIEHYRKARQLFVRSHDDANLAAVELLLADAFDYARDRDIAMQHRLACLDTMRRSGDTKQLDSALFEAGASSSPRWPWAADFLFGECTREAVSRQRFVFASLASMWRSTLAGRRNDFTGAGEQARLASLYSQQTVDSGQRALVAAMSNRLTANSERDASALRKITQSITFFEHAGNHAWLPQLFRQRALIHDQSGNRAAAEADFRAAIDSAERILSSAAPATMRDGFAGDVRGNFEDLIEILVDRGARLDALAVAERVRRIGAGLLTDADALAVIRSMRQSTVAVVFEISSDRIFTWLVTRDSITFVATGNAPAAIAQLSRDMSAEDVRAALYDALVRPWISDIPHESALVILAPPILAGVPFGALVDRQSGRAVIDDHKITLASSLASLREVAVTLSRSDRVLIVSDPAYRQLPRLTASLQEAERVSANYEHPVVLLGEQATVASVLASAATSDVLHFSGHAVVNDLAPELSSLMLAADGRDDTHLYVHELLQRRFPLKLVVLSACSTAQRRSGDLRGSLTIARAFLDGGARAVVGTRWSVSDAAAAAFSESLHKELSNGEDVATAARTAQLQLRLRFPLDSTWAAFDVFEGLPLERSESD